MNGRASPREAGDREIEASPEEVHRAHLAEIAAPKHLEDAIGLHERPPESVRRIGVVSAVRAILVEGRRVFHLVRLSVNRDFDPKLGQVPHHVVIEVGDGPRLKREAPFSPVGGAEAQAVVDEVELDFDVALGKRNGRRREAARRHVERHVPGVVHPG